MRHRTSRRHPIATGLALLLAASAAAAAPESLFDRDDLQRNGAVSRRLWAPEFASAQLGGLQVSAGIALGLRDSVRAHLGASVAPALTVRLDEASSLSLLAGNDGGVMLVVQTRR